MRALSYAIQEVIEQDSANRRRLANMCAYVYILGEEKEKRNVFYASMLHEWNARRRGVGWNCIANEIWASQTSQEKNGERAVIVLENENRRRYAEQLVDNADRGNDWTRQGEKGTNALKTDGVHVIVIRAK